MSELDCISEAENDFQANKLVLNQVDAQTKKIFQNRARHVSLLCYGVMLGGITLGLNALGGSRKDPAWELNGLEIALAVTAAGTGIAGARGVVASRRQVAALHSVIASAPSTKLFINAGVNLSTVLEKGMRRSNVTGVLQTGGDISLGASIGLATYIPGRPADAAILATGVAGSCLLKIPAIGHLSRTNATMASALERARDLNWHTYNQRVNYVPPGLIL